MSRRRLAIIVAAMLVVAVGLGTLAWGLGQRVLSPAGPSPATSAAPPSTTGPPRGFTEFRYQQAGFALAYPADWTRLNSDDPQVVLIAARSQQESFLVRVAELESPVGAEQLPAIKQVTDQIVTSNETVKLLAEPKQIKLAGLPGYFYFYTFQEPDGGQTGAHSHFFLFNGKKMISVVFQAVPAEHFPNVAPTFDQITGSFRLLKK